MDVLVMLRMESVWMNEGGSSRSHGELSLAGGARELAKVDGCAGDVEDGIGLDE